jgi:hypothetical protein
MTVEEIRNKLKEAFSHVILKEDNGRNRVFKLVHGKRLKYATSVTRYLKNFETPFDSEYWAARKAKEAGISKEAMLAQWSEKARKAILKGNALHLYLENQYTGEHKSWRECFPADDRIETEKYMDNDKKYLTEFNDVLKSAEAFVVKESGLIHIASEFPVGIDTIGEAYKINAEFCTRLAAMDTPKHILEQFESIEMEFSKSAEFMLHLKSKLSPSDFEVIQPYVNMCGRFTGMSGIIDQLFYSEELNGLCIYDWKQGKPIAKSNYYQKMLYPYNKYDDCSYNKYSLQLAFYKRIIEEVSHIPVKECRLVHFGKTYESMLIKDFGNRHFVRTLGSC